MTREKIPLISFPEREWTKIKKALNLQDFCTTIRSCEELGKYATGNVYRTPWKELILVTNVKRFDFVEDIPTWSELDKGMKISARYGSRYGFNQWELITFKKIM